MENDTVLLLRECDSGAKMGVKSIDDVLKYASSDILTDRLLSNKHEHEKLSIEIQNQLEKQEERGKSPGIIATGMSWMKTNMKLSMNESDGTIADLMTDGCNMGIKSINKYLNEYKNADDASKSLARRLISIEESLRVGVQEFL